jgi:hypothetical protein
VKNDSGKIGCITIVLNIVEGTIIDNILNSFTGKKFI